MAEISQSGDKAPHGKGKVRSKKLSTKVDMTPMVDLAFLLLTFFILTSTFQKMNTLQLDMPDHSQADPPPVQAENVLNVALGENNKIFWWIGIEPPVSETNFSKSGLRNLFLRKKAENPHLVVLVKPKDNCKYQNIVDVLDEIDITGMKRFSIVEFTEDDEKLIALK